MIEENGGLKQNVFYAIRIELKKTERGRKVTVFANGINLFNEVGLVDREEEGDEAMAGDGDFGVMCKGCRCVVKEWSVQGFREDGSAASEYKMSNEELLNLSPEER